MTDIERSEFKRMPGDQEALEGALRRATIALFGTFYDFTLSRIEDPLSYEERSKRALDVTLTRLGIDVHSVIEMARDEAWANKHLPASAKRLLANFAQKEAEEVHSQTE